MSAPYVDEKPASMMDDPWLYQTNQIELVLKNKFKEYSQYNGFNYCTDCGKRRLIYCNSVQDLSSRCFDCYVKHTVDEELKHGTSNSIWTKKYLSDGQYMNVRKLLVKHLGNDYQFLDEDNNDPEFDIEEDDAI